MGREHPVKNQAAIVRAFNLVATKIDAVFLLLVGPSGGGSAEVDEAVAKSPRPERIKRLGYRDDVQALLGAADCFVFASRAEGLPGAIVEALASGLPIVAFDIDSVRAAAGGEQEGIILVPLDDVNEMARSFVRLCAEPDTARNLGQLGRRRFKDSFTLTRVVAAMDEVYQFTGGRPMQNVQTHRE